MAYYQQGGAQPGAAGGNPQDAYAQYYAQYYGQQGAQQPGAPATGAAQVRYSLIMLRVV